MPLSHRQIARLAHEAVRNRQMIVLMGMGRTEKSARADSLIPWHMLHGSKQDEIIGWVETALLTKDASPAVFYDKSSGRYSKRRFDNLSVNEQYEVFLFRAIVLSQVDWDEGHIKEKSTVENRHEEAKPTQAG